MESITYEWGAYNHHNNGHDVSPDDAAQTQIASGMRVVLCCVNSCAFHRSEDVPLTRTLTHTHTHT